MTGALRKSMTLVRQAEYRVLFNKIRIALLHSWVHKDKRMDAWMRVVDSWQDRAMMAVDSNGSVVVYTCVTNGYDVPCAIPERLQERGSQFVLFTDDDGLIAEGWDRRSIPESIAHLESAQINRYIKLHPYEFFNSDYSVYVDGNLRLEVAPQSLLRYAAASPYGFASFAHGLRDCVYDEAKACTILGKGCVEGIERQAEHAASLGIAPHSGLIEACVLVSDLRNDACRKLYQVWWDMFNRYGSGRDQLALPCALAVCGYDIEDIGMIGLDIRSDTRFVRFEHGA